MSDSGAELRELFRPLQRPITFPDTAQQHQNLPVSISPRKQQNENCCRSLITMADKTVNGVAVADILRPFVDQPELVERIAERKVPAPALAIVGYDPKWPEYFQTFKSRILTAFENNQPGPDGSDTSSTTILAMNHVGSTSVPNLPAKAIIDIDLVLSSHSLASETFYVPRLEAAGFQFLLREPAWHGHRFFCASEPMACNLHVWGPRCPEVERHRIFRDWLCDNEGDRELYAKTKAECAAASREKGESGMEYNARKEAVIKEILGRAFKELGYSSE